MSANCDVIVIFLIYGQFEAIPIPHSECMICKTCIFINSNLWSYKNWEKRTKKKHSSHTIVLNKGIIFDKKWWFFCKKNADISKNKGVLVLKDIFSKTTYVCVLTSQISSFYHKYNEF